jgi:hypothetical protein
MKKSRKPLLRVGRRRAASILGMPLRTLEAEIAAKRIRTERVRSREYITICELARYVTKLNCSEVRDEQRRGADCFLGMVADVSRAL